MLGLLGDDQRGARAPREQLTRLSREQFFSAAYVTRACCGLFLSQIDVELSMRRPLR